MRVISGRPKVSEGKGTIYPSTMKIRLMLDCKISITNQFICTTAYLNSGDFFVLHARTTAADAVSRPEAHHSAGKKQNLSDMP